MPKNVKSLLSERYSSINVGVADRDQEKDRGRNIQDMQVSLSRNLDSIAEDLHHD